jgi:hypothetical protein
VQSPQDQQADPIIKSINQSKKMIEELKILFAFLTRSDKKFADPTNVLQSLVDNHGMPLEIGN